jgi:hypothetical protein
MRGDHRARSNPLHRLRLHRTKTQILEIPASAGVAPDRFRHGGLKEPPVMNAQPQNQTSNALIPVDGFGDLDPTSSPLRGPGVRFKDGGYYTFGDKLDVAEKTFAVLELKRGWQKLAKDTPPEYLIREPGQPMPMQPVVPKDDWPLDLNGQPAHPWKSTHYLVLLDTATGEVSTFWSNTVGGNVAIAALRDQVEFMRKCRPGAIPIVALESRDMPTQFGGTKPRPHFQISGWKAHNAEPQQLGEVPLVAIEAPSLAEELNDEIPDLGAGAPKKKNKKI